MEIKRIAVCGCSFMTSSRDNYFKLKGPSWPVKFPWTLEELPMWVQQELKSFGYTHYPNFIDLIDNVIDTQLLYLSQPGASNFMIRQQIDKAIDLTPDLVIISATDSGRVDLVNDLLLRKHYYAHQNSEQDKQKSYYLLQGGLDKLIIAKIPFIFLPGPLRDCNWSQYNTVWPNNQIQPWDTIPMRLDIPNHNTLDSHKEFFKTLVNILPDWSH